MLTNQKYSWMDLHFYFTAKSLQEETSNFQKTHLASNSANEIKGLFCVKQFV